MAVRQLHVWLTLVRHAVQLSVARRGSRTSGPCRLHTWHSPSSNITCGLPARQDEDGGGISDRPEDVADVYHTFFGVAGLALLGHTGLQAVDPTYALPVDVMAAVRARHAARAAAGVPPGLSEERVAAL
jgi:hypothetical protein